MASFAHVAGYSTRAMRQGCVSRAVAIDTITETSVRTSSNGHVEVRPPVKPAAAAPFIHVIEKSAWENGIPLVMGCHVMPSGEVAPVSTSKGAGKDVAQHVFQYPDGEFESQVNVMPTAADAAAALVDVVVQASNAAIAAKGSFAVALSGGSALTSLEALARADVDFSRWHVFFVDDRCVPLDSADSNYRTAMNVFLDEVAIRNVNIRHLLPGVSVEQAAIHYEGQMLQTAHTVLPQTAEGLPQFDLVVLGIGEDAHVASLFPNRMQLAEKTRWCVSVPNAPKAPAERVTMTLPVINAAKQVALFAAGEGKASAVQRVLEVQSLPGALPAQLVRPADLTWIVDAAAASQLSVDAWSNAKQFPRSQL